MVSRLSGSSDVEGRGGGNGEVPGGGNGEVQQLDGTEVRMGERREFAVELPTTENEGHGRSPKMGV